jgi:putative transcriptional regulator
MKRERRETNDETLAGALLLAHPSLKESTFHRTVILMSVHNAEGAMGVVLNRPMGKRLGELQGDFALGPLAGVPLCVGGPVEQKQLVLVAWQAQDNGFRLHFGIEPDQAKQLRDAEDAHLRAFVGYAGWTAGQLEQELERNTWVVVTAPPDLFSLPMDASLWRTLLAREGAEWRLLADEPEETGQN